MSTTWFLLWALACDGKSEDDTAGADGGTTDGGVTDGGGSDGGTTDGGGTDGGTTDGGGSDGGGTDGGGTDGGGSDGGTDCTATVEGLHPRTGSVDVALDTTVSATMSGADPTAVLELYAASGDRVDGAQSIEGGLVVFTPAAPLLPDTGYQATLEWCGGYEVWSFVTAEGSAWSGDPTGTVYQLDLAAGDWVEPAGVGTILGASMGNLLLVEVLSVEETMELRLAWSDEAGSRQDLCLPTSDETVTDLSGLPAFTLGPADGSVTYAGEELILRDRWLSATFTEDLGALDPASFGGQADMRDWIDLLGPAIGTDEPADICALIVSFGTTCEACADGASLCLELRAEELPAEASGIEVEERTAAEIAADPRCR